MTRRNKLIVLIFYLLTLTLCMSFYRSDRSKKIKLLHAELARVASEKEKVRAAEAEVSRLTKLVPSETNTYAFIETLYQLARESGLKQHEVITESEKRADTARPGGANTSEVAKHRLKISANGSYRSFAEYVRKIQNIERFNRIIDFKLSPDAFQLKGTLTIELYSLPVK